MTHKIRGSRIGRIADGLVSFLSGEWILEWTPYTANGGTVVAARTLWLTFWVYVPAFLISTRFREGKVFELDLRQGAADFVDTMPWLAAIFGAVYFAFYTRFSSQWTYLADLYNRIVEAKLAMPSDDSGAREDTLASWKAGFIEDAQDLHLAAKPMFLVAVQKWGAEDLVAQKFAANTIGGAPRLKALLSRLAVIRVQAQQSISPPDVD